MRLRVHVRLRLRVRVFGNVISLASLKYYWNGDPTPDSVGRSPRLITSKVITMECNIPISLNTLHATLGEVDRAISIYHYNHMPNLD